jgi:predicted phage terminase large subunit-like protein
MIELKPQPGPQTAFLSSPADIVLYGGAAGGGKTYGELLEATRHIDNKKFGAVIFRRESSQIANEGGPWDTALDMYSGLGARFVTTPRHIAKFPSGAKITFSHMQLERHTRQWDGSQIPLIMFDELQHFTAAQFWYMLSRNRSTCGVRPYIRATLNPDPDSFLRELLAWWIDQVTGDPIIGRSGKIRWFIRSEGVVLWGDTKEELTKKYGPKARPKSFTFIMSSLIDNPALMKADPDYEGNIEAMLDYEKKRLKGNWFARPSAGEMFKRAYFNIIDREEVPYLRNIIRYWDRACTVPSDENPDPDWTAGAKVGVDANNNVYIFDIFKDRLPSLDVIKSVEVMSQIDTTEVTVGLEQDPGQAGKMEMDFYVNKLIGCPIEPYPKRRSKMAYWRPLATQAKNGNVYLVRGAWNEAFIQEAEGVTDGTQKGHDDQVDAVAGGFMVLAAGITSVGSSSIEVR